MKAFVTALVVVAVMAVGCGGSSSDSGSGGVVHITMWHGFVDTEGAAMKSMVAQYNATHKNIQVKVQYAGNTDYALQKVLTAIASGDPPDISYLYGSWAANIARAPSCSTSTITSRTIPRSAGTTSTRPSARQPRWTARSWAFPRWSTTWRWSTTRSCSTRPTLPTPPPIGRGTTSPPPPRSSPTRPPSSSGGRTSMTVVRTPCGATTRSCGRPEGTSSHPTTSTLRSTRRRASRPHPSADDGP